ncbi:hypothetical protein COB11_01955 [Candidatus Aerophobetes bacterium]|uniref:HTH araC/xylS-type domain-containing protein n=1 Tax=Aerophobetes bacterium TaxID=2030807 RepID=A0A2A4YLC6_UNCAE|nr:MAG: hypothetical protein COB11_01955 [Candidatus Aerophobetes bacterium]
MDHYVKQILKVLLYIDENYGEKITVDQLAEIACYSPFHFHRVFQSVVNESVYQYVKRIRLDRAARKLAYSKANVTSIALESGFDTPSSFTKAFRKHKGDTPKNFRALFKSAYNITLNLKEIAMIKPDTIENIDNLDLHFIREQGDYRKSGVKAWEKLNHYIEEKHLESKELRFFGISHDDPNITDKENLRYDACIHISSGAKEEHGLSRQTYKGGKCAIFIHKGSYEGLKETFDQIFLKWFSESKERCDDSRLVLSEYFNKEYKDTNPEKLITKIFIPLK